MDVVQHPKLIYPQCNLLTKLLKTFEEKKCFKDGSEVPQRIILISPTAHSDSNQIFKSLKNLDWVVDVITEYSDDVLKNKMEEVRRNYYNPKNTRNIKECGQSLRKKKLKT